MKNPTLNQVKSTKTRHYNPSLAFLFFFSPNGSTRKAIPWRRTPRIPLFSVCMLALIHWGPIVNIRPKHPLFPRKTRPTSWNGKPRGRWEGTSNKLKGPVCVQQTHTHTHEQRSKWKRRGPSYTQGKCFGRYYYCIDMLKKKGQGGGLKLNRPYRGSDIFISLSRLTFPLKQTD